MLVHPRRRFSLRRGFSVACEAVRVEPFDRVGGRLVDLSHQGALLECNGAVSSGDELVVSFRAPKSGRILDAVAEVRRVIRHEYGARAGLAFVEMDWDDRAELFVRLMGTPPPIPRRRPLVDYAATVRRIGYAPHRPAPSLPPVIATQLWS